MNIDTLQDVLLIGGFYITLVGMGVKVMIIDYRETLKFEHDMFYLTKLQEKAAAESARRAKLSQRGVDDDLQNIPLI